MPEVIDKKILKALSIDARQEIIKMLSRRPYTASEIAKIMKRHVTTVTEHLQTLEEAGLVQKKESNNKWVYYSLSNKGEHLFQPRYFTWVISLVISLVAFVGGLGSIFFKPATYATQSAEKSVPVSTGMTQQVTDETARVAQTAPDLTVIIAIIIISLAVVGMLYSSYRIKKVKSIRIKLK